MKVAYLCLQATREGQASHAHVHEIIKGLQNHDVSVDLYEPKYVRKKKLPGAIGRLLGGMSTQIKLILKMKQYDLIYIRAHYLSFITSIFSNFFKKKVVIEINGPINDGQDNWPIIKPFMGGLIRARLFEVKNANGIIVVTPKLKEEIEMLNEYVEIIPNGANIEYFNPLRKNDHVNLQKPYVVFVGVMAKWQGIDKIVNSVKSDYWPSEVKLVFIGDGVDKEIVENAAKQNDNIIYLGKRSYKEVGAFIANSIASLAVISKEGSRGEIGASPVKLFEGMASGVPVIATNIDFMGDLVRKHDCGIVIRTEYQKDELAQAVQSILIDKEEAERMGNNGRNAMIKYHSWQKRADKTFDFLNQIINH